MTADLYDIRRRLTTWGRLCRAVGIGYPTMSATERARVGRGGSFDGPTLPDDLAAIDLAVARAEPQHKLIIVECYTKGGSWQDHAARLRDHHGMAMSKPNFFRRKNLAEKRVYWIWTHETESHIVGAR
jgi:hypothetical protein